MEEFNKENEIEQRPSTKYGRTAYQQQMQQEQQMGTQSEQTYAQQPYQEYRANSSYTTYQETHPAIKKWYTYVLMVLVAVSIIINCISNVLLADAYRMGNTLEEVIDAMFLLAQQPIQEVLVTFSEILLWATIIFLVLDIIQLQKAGKKIAGAIAFAIFFRPAYFIWRARLLGEKKTVPIIYTVAVSSVLLAEFIILLNAAVEMLTRTML